MKKIIILGLVLLMAVVFASTFAIAQGGKGAVKVDLCLRTGGEGMNEQGYGPAAGWAIINTTASGKIQVEVHMYDAVEGTYDVYVCTSPPYSYGIYAQLTAKKNGIGNAHAELDIPEHNLEIKQLEVKVVVKIGSGGAIVGYTNGLTEVPLKKQIASSIYIQTPQPLEE